MKRTLSLLVAFIMVLSMLPVTSFAAQTRTVYLDPASGLDTNDGLTEANPVKTVSAAYAALEGADAGKVVFLSTLTLSALTSFPSCSIPVTLTSKTGAEGITSSKNIYFQGPTTLEKITLTSQATNGYTLVAGGGHKFVVGQDVTVLKTTDYYFSLAGGSNAGNCESVDLTVTSGNWHNIYIGSHGARTVNGDCNVTISGITMTGSLSVGYQATVKGNVNVQVTDTAISSVYACSTQPTGSVDGNITVTLGAGASITNYTIESNTMSVVKGTNTLILDGGQVATVKKSSENAASGATAVMLKSGRIDSCNGAADTVTVDIPTGKNLTVGGQVDANSVKSAGTLTFAGEATLTAATVTGTVLCDVSGEVLPNHLYVSAPSNSDIQFNSESGIKGNSGQWTVGGVPADDDFVGLILWPKTASR